MTVSTPQRSSSANSSSPPQASQASSSRNWEDSRTPLYSAFISRSSASVQHPGYDTSEASILMLRILTGIDVFFIGTLAVSMIHVII